MEFCEKSKLSLPNVRMAQKSVNDGDQVSVDDKPTAVRNTCLEKQLYSTATYDNCADSFDHQTKNA